MTYKILLFKILGFLIGLVIAFIAIKVIEKYENKKLGKRFVQSLDNLETLIGKIKPNSFPSVKLD